MRHYTLPLILTLLQLSAATLAQPQLVDKKFQSIVQKEITSPDHVRTRTIDNSFCKEYRSITVSQNDIDAFYQAVDEAAPQAIFYIRQDAGGVNNFIYDVANNLYNYKAAMGGKSNENMLLAIYETPSAEGCYKYSYAISWRPTTDGKCMARLVWGRIPCKEGAKENPHKTPLSSYQPESLQTIKDILADREADIRHSTHIARSANSLSYVDYIKFTLPYNPRSKALLEKAGKALAAMRPHALHHSSWQGYRGRSGMFNIHFDGQPMGDGQLMVFPPYSSVNIWRTSVPDRHLGNRPVNYNLLYAPTYDTEDSQDGTSELQLKTYTGYILINNDTDELFTIEASPQRDNPSDAFEDIFSDFRQLGDTLFDFRQSPVSMETYRDRIATAQQTLETYNLLYNDELKAINESYSQLLTSQKVQNAAESSRLRSHYDTEKTQLRKQFDDGRITADIYTRRLRAAADSYVKALDSLSVRQLKDAGADENAYSRKVDELRRHYGGRLALMSQDGVPHSVISELLLGLTTDYLGAPEGSTLRAALAETLLRLIQFEADHNLQPIYRQQQANHLASLREEAKSDERLKKMFEILNIKSI